jgi:hypothetical protein
MKRLAPSLAALLAAAVVHAASAPPPEQLLPGDTLGVLTLPEFAKSRAQWSQWPAAQLWTDPAIKAFKDKFLAKFKTDLVEPLEKEFGVKFADYSGLAQGQVTLAITRNGWDTAQPGQEPGFLFLLDARDRSEQLRTNLTNLKKKWVDSGKQIKTEKIRDLEFTTLIFNSDDLSKTLDKVFPDPAAGHETLEPPKPKKPGKKVEWIIGQSDALLIIGSAAKDIEKVLIRQSGGGVPSLGEQPAFAASHAAQFRDALGYLWVDLKTIITTFRKQAAAKAAAPDAANNPNTPPADKVLAALGLTGLNSLAGSLREVPEGCVVNVHLSAPEAGRKGLLKILSFDPKDAAPPPFVPGDAVKFSRWRLDLQKGWAALESTLIEAFPQAAGVMKLIMDTAGKDKDPGFDLRKQLIGNLGDDLISFEKAPRKQTLADLNSPPSLFLLSSPRAEQLAGALKALSGILPMQQAKVKEREFLGRKVYTMALPPTPSPGSGRPVERALNFAASGGYVAMSTDVAMLEEYLRSSDSKGRTLRETPGLAEAADKVGGLSTGLFGFENQVETTRAALEILKKESGTLATLFQNSPLAGRLGVGAENNKLKDWLDFSLLPPFDRIAKYFHLTVWTGSVTADGVTFKIFTPHPPGLRK